ncbi:MAG: heme ABC transporter ATP-binding protein CcmA [Methylomonas sp.]|nr:MAG: heme ABC transporter ATP-binding protein CcmA [Methylomonas sp.]PPD27369.1 MAG: heme ABC transporter ATP-binding protein CcmA [Methylomonas sp.]PPD39345.1 MAG: heme ABC transporter ATP-binding protein CcmA [Methylomonas sp.]PPD41968.1 MAG: heme ABC transporter ATP-binding protein CcmA [Methylomonas sp.]PPD51801.1 MAG: heme ABC transporter ATP-binding protein CcmA [Methylomonas sp.]
MDGKCSNGLQVSGLACSRDDRLLFSGLSFVVAPGEALLLEGSNGSGKTSLLRILCGFRDADAGELFWRGRPLVDSDYLVEMAYVGHAEGIKKELTVLENLRFSRALNQPGKLSIDQALAKVQLAGFDDNAVQTLSAGQKRRLSLARLLITANTLWILDEPFTSLDRQGMALIETLIGEHVAAGGMVVMTSHHDLNLPVARLQRIHLDTCH